MCALCLLFSVPFWAVIAIAVVAVLILLCCCICVCKYCCRRKKSKDSKKGLKGVVDLKSVQMLGHSYKEKVRLPHLTQYFCYIFLHGMLQYLLMPVKRVTWVHCYSASA